MTDTPKQDRCPLCLSPHKEVRLCPAKDINGGHIEHDSDCPSCKHAWHSIPVEATPEIKRQLQVAHNILRTELGRKCDIHREDGKCEICREIEAWMNRESIPGEALAANFVSEVHPRPDDPSCHVCGALMVPERFKCLSCGAHTGCTEPATVERKEEHGQDSRFGSSDNRLGISAGNSNENHRQNPSGNSGGASQAVSAPGEAPREQFCFECDTPDKCVSAETCYGHHEGFPRLSFGEKAAHNPSTPGEAMNAEPTVEDALRVIRKIEKCTSDGAKLILMRNFVEKSAAHVTAARQDGWKKENQC